MELLKDIKTYVELQIQSAEIFCNQKVVKQSIIDIIEICKAKIGEVEEVIEEGGTKKIVDTIQAQVAKLHCQLREKREKQFPIMEKNDQQKLTEIKILLENQQAVYQNSLSQIQSDILVLQQGGSNSFDLKKIEIGSLKNLEEINSDIVSILMDLKQSKQDKNLQLKRLQKVEIEEMKEGSYHQIDSMFTPKLDHQDPQSFNDSQNMEPIDFGLEELEIVKLMKPQEDVDLIQPQCEQINPEQKKEPKKTFSVPSKLIDMSQFTYPFIQIYPNFIYAKCASTLIHKIGKHKFMLKSNQQKFAIYETHNNKYQFQGQIELEGQSCFVVLNIQNMIVFGCFLGHIYFFDNEFKLIKHLQLRNGGVYTILQFNERFLVCGQVDSWIQIIDLQNEPKVHDKIQGDQQLSIKNIYGMQEYLGASIPMQEPLIIKQYIVSGYSGLQLIEISFDLKSSSFCIQAISQVFLPSKNIAKFIEFIPQHLLVVLSDDPNHLLHLDLEVGKILKKIEKSNFGKNSSNEFFRLEGTTQFILYKDDRSVYIIDTGDLNIFKIMQTLNYQAKQSHETMVLMENINEFVQQGGKAKMNQDFLVLQTVTPADNRLQTRVHRISLDLQTILTQIGNFKKGLGFIA